MISFPTDQSVFESLMLEVDALLAGRNIGIPQRPIHALMEIGDRFKISLPITGRHNIKNPESDNWQVSKRILDWYEKRYGKSLKVDPCLGRLFESINGDLWVIRLPRLFGSMTFYTSATLDSDQRLGRCNIADLIDDFTIELRRSLTSIQEAEITNRFSIAFEATQWLEQNKRDPLFRLSLANIEASVEAATRRRHDFGLSKWESLQATEKVMKAAIRVAGGVYSNTHNLRLLQTEAGRAGLSFDVAPWLDAIQCSPGIRYGDESCDKQGVVLAHDCMFQAIWTIKSDMEKRAP